jgi:hypothetical protein
MVSLSKKESIHFTQRMDERYGLRVNRKARSELVACIQNGKAEVIKKLSHSRSIFRVPIFLSKELCRLNDNIQFGDRLVMMYDTKRGKLATVYPIGDKRFY